MNTLNNERELYRQLILAIKTNNIPIVEEIIRFNAKLLNQPLVNNKTALMLAIKEKSYDMVRFLIANKALNINFFSCRTALDEAISLGDEKIVNELLQFGAIASQNSVHIACSCGYLSILEAIINATPNQFNFNSALMQAIIYDHLSIVRFLIENELADVNYEEPDDIKTYLTPLTSAIEHKKVAIANYLVSKKADINYAKQFFQFNDFNFSAFLKGQATAAESSLKKYERQRIKIQAACYF